MTLTSEDIDRAKKLYTELSALHARRRAIRTGDISVMVSGDGTFHRLESFEHEELRHLRSVLDMTVRGRAAAIVAELHKMGCEAVLTPKDLEAEAA
jgi:hypothetical protein